MGWSETAQLVPWVFCLMAAAWFAVAILAFPRVQRAILKATRPAFRDVELRLTLYVAVGSAAALAILSYMNQMSPLR